MKITVFNEREQTTNIVNFAGATVLEFLHFLKINPETVIVTRNNEVILEAKLLQDNDIIELLSVISGG